MDSLNNIVNYKCEKCETEFPNKKKYNRHLQKKKSCVPHYIKKSENEYACRYCNKVFTRSSGVNNHIEFCIDKIKLDSQNELEEKNKEIERLKAELDKYKKDDEKLFNEAKDEIILFLYKNKERIKKFYSDNNLEL